MKAIVALLESKRSLQAISIVIFLLTFYKAATMSMTHDESSSFYYLNDVSVLGHLFDKNAWPNANNHWLNTILFQLTSNIFGPKEWVIRLPNVLSFLIYAYFIIELCNNFKSFGLKLFVFGFAVTNSYLLDFFATARGYGLGLAFSTAGIYYFSQFLQNKLTKDGVLGSLSFLLATLSLFSYLSLYFAVLAGLICVLFFEKERRKDLIKPLLPVVGIALVTILLVYTPLKALSGNEEFKWGALTLMESFTSLFTNVGYSKWYMPNGTFVFGILFGLLSLILIYALSKSSTKEEKSALFFKFSVLYVLLFLIGLVLSRYIFDTYYPVDRKTIMYIPLISLLVGVAINEYFTIKFSNLFGYTVGLYFLIHFVFSFQSNATREWWYDADTKDFVTQIMADGDQNANKTIGCNWFFYHSINHYSKSVYQYKLILHPYNKDIDVSKVYDYFICFDSDFGKLEPYYDVLFKNSSGRMILKKK